MLFSDRKDSRPATYRKYPVLTLRLLTNTAPLTQRTPVKPAKQSTLVSKPTLSTESSMEMSPPANRSVRNTTDWNSIILQDCLYAVGPSNNASKRAQQSQPYKPLFACQTKAHLKRWKNSSVTDLSAPNPVPVISKLSTLILEDIKREGPQSPLTPRLSEMILMSKTLAPTATPELTVSDRPTIFDFMAQRRYSDETHRPSSNEEYFMRQSVLQYREAALINGLKTSMAVSPAKLTFPRSKRAVLALDLDETLIHSEPVSEGENYDAVLVFPAAHGLPAEKMGVKKRPHLEGFLAKMDRVYDLVVFTASSQDYADQIIEVIDPLDQYFKLRLYRQDCIRINNKFVKDLNCFDTSQVYLIDNYIYSFAWNLDNGIPIYPFYSNPYDQELLALGDILSSVNERDLSETIEEELSPSAFFAHLKKVAEAEDIKDIVIN
jgi:Dullard-like phosphatase family protein